MSDLKIGVIGSGGRGKSIASHAHEPENGSRIVACCDISDAALEENRKDYGDDIFTTHDYRELLKQDLDAVFVCTPDYDHEEHALAALRAGKAVYLEKPMAISIEGCDRILQAAYETKTRLYLGHNMRHMRFVQKMKSVIDSGAIGEVKAVWCRHFVGHGGDYYFRDWHAERKYSTGLLLQKAAHDIDIIHWLAGSFSQRINALGGLTVYGDVKNRLSKMDGPRPIVRPLLRLEVWPPTQQRELNADIDVEDISMMQMELKSGAFASYQQCHFTPDYWRNYCVIGTEGRIENFGDGEPGTTIKLWNKRIIGWSDVPDISYHIHPEQNKRPEQSNQDKQDKKGDQGGHGGADPKIVEEFVRFARDGGKIMTSPLAARYSVAAGCVATESLRNGGIPLDVPALAPDIEKHFASLE